MQTPAESGFPEQPAGGRRPAPPPAVDAEAGVEADAGEVIEELRDRDAGRRNPAQSLAEVAVMLLILFAVAAFFLAETPVYGTSMAPTLKDGQRLLISRSTYLLSLPQRGDVVVMRDPLGSDRQVARRVIGLPNEKVEVRGRQVLIDNQPLNEPYLANSPFAGEILTGAVPYQLKADELFVMGDNRVSIDDSRSWGPIQIESVTGRAWLVYWPPDDINITRHERYAEADGVP